MKLQEIFEESGLSLSKFATLLGKDRRTISSWLKNGKELDSAMKAKICKIFRYPMQIWDSPSLDFNSEISKLNKEEIKIIDDGYVGGLKYIFENENEGSLILHPSFPNPAYRDFILPFVYENIDDEKAKFYRKKRGEKMRAHSFVASEWYSVKSLLEFCFSPIGNFYTKNQKIQILELIIATFKDNLNKSLYFFDSFDLKIFGLEMFYLSINAKENSMFFKIPAQMFIVEIRNTLLVRKIHHYYTHAQKCPSHIDPKDACLIMEILLACIKDDLNLLQSLEKIKEKTKYFEYFKKALSLDLRSAINF